VDIVMADTGSRHYELQGRIDKLETQKSKILHELDEIEEQYGKTDKLYKKYLPLIVDSVADIAVYQAKSNGRNQVVVN
jgi:hypothetical protein